MPIDHPDDQISSDDVIAELVRLREVDAQEWARVETELRSEIAALWLRLGPKKRPLSWLPRIFG